MRGRIGGRGVGGWWSSVVFGYWIRGHPTGMMRCEINANEPQRFAFSIDTEASHFVFGDIQGLVWGQHTTPLHVTHTHAIHKSQTSTPHAQHGSTAQNRHLHGVTPMKRDETKSTTTILQRRRHNIYIILRRVPREWRTTLGNAYSKNNKTKTILFNCAKSRQPPRQPSRLVGRRVPPYTRN